MPNTFTEPSSIALNGPFLAFHTVELPPPATLRINERSAGGSLSGAAPVRAICRNLTTGQTVTIKAIEGDARDCLEAGLDVRPGDQIIQTTAGSAE